MKLAEFFKDFDNGVVPYWFIDKNLRDKDNDELVVSELRTWPNVTISIMLMFVFSIFKNSLPFALSATLFGITVIAVVITVFSIFDHISDRRKWKPAIECYGLLYKMGCVGYPKVLTFEQSREAGVEHLTKLCLTHLRREAVKHTCLELDSYDVVDEDDIQRIKDSLKQAIHVMLESGLYDRHSLDQTLTLCHLKAAEEVLQCNAAYTCDAVENKVEECLGNLSRNDAAELLRELPRVSDFVKRKAITPANWIAQPAY